MNAPIRIQLSRKKGWRMPPNTVKVTRGPGMKWGNPFRLGGWFMIGDPDNRRDFMRMIWCQAANKAIADRTPGKFTLINTSTEAVEFFRRLMEISPMDVYALRGKNLACWCPLGSPCHADVLLEFANA